MGFLVVVWLWGRGSMDAFVWILLGSMGIVAVVLGMRVRWKWSDTRGK
jgi:hypothetical protein